jgi:hypothetical protein
MGDAGSRDVLQNIYGCGNLVSTQPWQSGGISVVHNRAIDNLRKQRRKLTLKASLFRGPGSGVMRSGLVPCKSAWTLGSCGASAPHGDGFFEGLTHSEIARPVNLWAL